MAHLLVLTLSTGEAALPVLLQQLASQTFRRFELEVFSGLRNREAHEQLYRAITDMAGSFEFFLKLDADMTLRCPSALEDALRAAEDCPEGQHFVFPIYDFFTNEETLAVHLFRSGVRWPAIDDELFVDPDPPNVRQVIWQGPPAPFVNHGEVVSDLECFSYGLHKFLKVAQRNRAAEGRLANKAHKFHRHMRNCARVRELYRLTRARRHLLALTGIVWAMQHPELTTLESKSAIYRLFEEEIRPKEEEWLRETDDLAGSEMAWRLALIRSLGIKRAFGKI